MSARTSTAKRKQERRIQTSTSGGLWRTEGTKTHEVRPRSPSASPVSETSVEIRRPGSTRAVPGWAYRTHLFWLPHALRAIRKRGIARCWESDIEFGKYFVRETRGRVSDRNHLGPRLVSS